MRSILTKLVGNFNILTSEEESTKTKGITSVILQNIEGHKQI